jgi:aspartate/methionine/tyrosine aminotransferase
MAFFEPFKLERFFAEYEFNARHLLSSSDCETRTTRELLALEPGAAEGYLDLGLGYTETRGAPALREAIASLYSGIGPDSTLVVSGAEEGILYLCMALLSPGDRVVVNAPCYQSLSEVPRALGCELAPWPLVEEGSGPASSGGRRWAFDVEGLARLLAEPAKLVILNAPHNPTGALPTREEFDAIVGLCRKAGAVLFSDEVYRGLELDPARRLPAACEAYENAVSLGVMSKGPGLAGLRIGWLASRRADLLGGAASAKDYGTICSSGPSEFLAALAARHMDSLLARSRAIVAANLELLSAFFARRSDFASWTPPEGGSIGFPRLSPEGPWARAFPSPGGGADCEALARRLVAEAGVMLLPGSCYDGDPSAFRLGFGRSSMPAALEALEAWLDGARGRTR